MSAEMVLWCFAGSLVQIERSCGPLFVRESRLGQPLRPQQGQGDLEDLSRAAAAFENKLSERTELHMQRWITANITGRQQGDWDT